MASHAPGRLLDCQLRLQDACEDKEDAQPCWKDAALFPSSLQSLLIKLIVIYMKAGSIASSNIISQLSYSTAMSDDLIASFQAAAWALDLLTDEYSPSSDTQKVDNGTPKGQLLALPLELQLQIMSYIGPAFPYQLSLRKTCRHFYHLIGLPEPPNTRRWLAVQIRAQLKDWFRKPRIEFACGTCLRLRPVEEFDDVNSSRRLLRKPGLIGGTCMDCSTCKFEGKEPKYKKGDLVIVRGRTHVVCLDCGHLKLPHEFGAIKYCTLCWNGWRRSERRLSKLN